MKKTMLGLVVVASLSGCAAMTGAPDQAIALLAPTQGSTVKGSVQFEQKGNKVLVIADVYGFAPNTAHGFHIHEKGDCSAADGSSAGGHFNPQGMPHGKGMTRHVGDMPNLVADANGVAKMSVELDLMTLTASAPNNIIGRSVIVHAQPDDFASQPTGNAGGRVACGVIKAQ